jgi:hypothetical protein
LKDLLSGRGDGSASKPAGETHADRAARRSAHMHDQLAPAQRLRDVDRRSRSRSRCRGAVACARASRAGRRCDDVGARSIGRACVVCRVGEPLSDAPASRPRHGDCCRPRRPAKRFAPTRPSPARHRPSAPKAPEPLIPTLRAPGAALQRNLQRNRRPIHTPCYAPKRCVCRAFLYAGGGTRTPDTRIMIRPEGCCGVSLGRLDWFYC